MKKEEKDEIAHSTLLGMLADGELHSGSVLAAALGVSRAAVWKRIRKLQELGIGVQKIRSSGYRLDQPLELLDAVLVSGMVSDLLHRESPLIEIVQQSTSTNQVLLERARGGRSPGLSFLLAEQQTQGRGRRGRAWISPFGSNIYMSALWTTDRGVQGLEGLSLAVGVGVASTLERVFGLPARLKWPNDVLLGDAKLGGILIEVDGDLSGPLSVVIGVGLNVNMPKVRMEAIDQPWTDIAQFSPSPVSRNAVAANLVVALVSVLDEFDRNGFAPFRDAWARLDAFAGRDVKVSGLSEPVSGKARGVDEKGALLIDTGGQLLPIVAGDVSLRVASDS